VVPVDLVGHEPVPQQARDGSEEGPGVGSKGAGLDEGDTDASAEVTSPVDRLVQGRGSASSGSLRRSKSRWNADAVGSDCPWYFEPSSGEPYGRSTGDDIRKNEICPIFIPK
jgi:hypothetical protein